MFVQKERQIGHKLAKRCAQGRRATDLWKFYFNRLVGLAKKRLVRDAAYDGEDLVVSVFDTFCRNVKAGRFELGDRDDIWSLLVVITMRKANDRLKLTRAAKRRLPGHPTSSTEEAPASELSPDLAALMSEQCTLLLKALADRELERVAILKLDGHSNREIAEEFDCSERSVGRMLNLIRRVWKDAIVDESPKFTR